MSDLQHMLGGLYDVTMDVSISESKDQGSLWLDGVVEILKKEKLEFYWTKGRKEGMVL